MMEVWLNNTKISPKYINTRYILLIWEIQVKSVALIQMTEIAVGQF